MAPIVIDPERLKQRLYKVPDLKIIWRDEWGAEPIKKGYSPVEFKFPVKRVFLTYTETDPCDDEESCKKAVKTLQTTHMGKGYLDVFWNFLVGGDGNVYEGRGWKIKPTKVKKFEFLNEKKATFDIAYIAKEKDQVTEEMKFQKGQLIRFALMHLMIRDPFDFMEDKVDHAADLKKKQERENAKMSDRAKKALKMQKKDKKGKDKIKDKEKKPQQQKKQKWSIVDEVDNA